MALAIGGGVSIGGGISFTPYVSLDPYWSSTSLLLPANGSNGATNNTFLDSSSNNFTITRNGDVGQGTFNPFSSAAPYSTANGGSVYFDGSGDYLTVSNASGAFTFGTGNFTVEAWVYLITMPTSNTYPNADWIVGGGPSNNNIGFDFAIGSTNLIASMTTFAAPTISTAHNMTTGTWYHLAMVRNGNTLSVYKNGTLLTSASVSGVTADPMTTGMAISAAEPSGATGGNMNGYISNLRIVKGTAVYTAAFTPSTQPLTAVSGTSLLLSGINASIIDNTMNSSLSTIGNTSISTTQSKWGGSSVYFDGSGDYLIVPTSSAMQFGTGDFTIECWVYLTAKPTTQPAIFCNYNSFAAGSISLFAGHSSSSTTQYQVAINGVFPAIQSTSTIVYNVWTHLAVVRSGSTITLYINGVADGTANSAASLNGVGSNWSIGTMLDFIADGYINGYVDDFRITKGVARYTSNFSVPTGPFPTQE